MRMLLFAVVILFVGCDFARECLEPDDNLVKETIRLENFESFNIDVSGEVVYAHSDDYHLIFEGPENYFEVLKVEVRNGRLEIKADRCFSGSTGYYFQIGAPDLSAATLNGEGRFVGTSPMGRNGEFKVTVNGAYDFTGVMETTDFSATVNGAGDVTVGGHAKTASVQITGAGNYSGLRMETANSDISITGAGGAYVYATEKLNVRITGAGNVKYVGHPEVSQGILGSGKVIDSN